MKVEKGFYKAQSQFFSHSQVQGVYIGPFLRLTYSLVVYNFINFRKKFGNIGAHIKLTKRDKEKNVPIKTPDQPNDCDYLNEKPVFLRWTFTVISVYLTKCTNEVENVLF